MEDKKKIVRIACEVQEALLKLRHSRYLELMRQLTCFARQLQELTTESRRLGLALAHGWQAAVQSCRSRAGRLLSDIRYSVPRIQQLTDGPSKDVPALSDLVGELNQIHQEFGDIEIDNAKGMISTVTEPITLEDIYLGPFKIELALNKLSELYCSSPYYVIALEPNPAATDESVTHPHVNSERLCEGDAAAAIKAALEEGRICDFFTLARSILNTYNADSPYVSLHDWDGEPCYECGYVMGSDSSYYCSFCERVFCEECSTYCRSCDEAVCMGCARKCEVCEESLCPRCARTRCMECQCVCCESCIDDGLCPNCQQESEVEDEPEGTGIERSDGNRAQAERSNSESEAKLASS